MLSKNLLPNASFELDFGAPVPTNWGDTQNELTLQLHLDLKPDEIGTTQVPQVPPHSEAIGETVDGERAARVETEVTLNPDETGESSSTAVGHLLSPMVSTTSCTPYTISVYARSDDSSAKLEIGLWTRPVDFRQSADSLSYAMLLSTEWQRFTFTCCTDELEERAVVDFKVTADKAGAVVWFDAAQLEQGPQATKFETRRSVEAAVAGCPGARSNQGRRDSSLIHLNDGPLKLSLTMYNHLAKAVNEPITLEIRELVGGDVIFTHTLVGPIAPGRSEQSLSLDFPFIGEFRARLIAGSGEQISPEDYIFVNYPVLEETYQGVMYTKYSAVHEIPAERSVLPWTNDRNWYADTQTTLIVTDDDEIHAQMSDGHTVMRTCDGGRTWDNLQVTKTVNTVLRDGTFLAVESMEGMLQVSRSSDQGRTWHPLGQIESSEHPQIGGIEQLHDGSLIIPVGIISPQTATGPLTVHAFRSTDGGMTWSDGSPICPGGEPQLLELQSGRLLAFCRNNPRIPPNDLQRPFRNEGPWRLWQRFQGARGLSSYTKRITVAESDDGGRTWHSQHPATFLLEEMHGGGVQLPDGRVVFLYTHRGPTYRGGERAKVSSDEGRTWRDELYFMTATPAYPGYSGSCVLPPHLADGKSGMILTLVGERSERNWGSEGPATPEGFQYMPRVQAIRWQPVE